jgi:hypothetical protein
VPPPDDDLDKTIRLRPVGPIIASATAAAPRRSAAIGLACALVLILVVGWWLSPPRPEPPVIPGPSSAPAAVRAIPIRPGTEAEILDHAARETTVFRLIANPRILVIDYPDLAAQGRAMNRVAAFVEKADTPKDRVLDDAELAAAIQRSGDTAETYYFGHDYRARDLARFFELADRDRQALNPNEEFLRHLLLQEGLLAADAVAAVLTVPRVDGETIDRRSRSVILRHELAHGEYFTNQAYVAFARRAWEEIFKGGEREAFRRFLGGQGYDTGNLDLMVNETQAFLVFTPDDRYINGEKLGMSEAALIDLRHRFIEAMPAGWLRDLAIAPAR